MAVDIRVTMRGGEDVVENRVMILRPGRDPTLWGSEGWIIEVVDLRESDSTRKSQERLWANYEEISGMPGTSLSRVMVDVNQNSAGAILRDSDTGCGCGRERRR
jgi:hypothetical protein